MMPSIAGQSTPFGVWPCCLEHLLETLDLVLRLGQVGLEALLELRVRRLLDHLRQRLGDLVLGVVDVLQCVHEQVIHRLDVRREQAHGCDPSVYVWNAAAAQKLAAAALGRENVRSSKGVPRGWRAALESALEKRASAGVGEFPLQQRQRAPLADDVAERPIGLDQKRLRSAPRALLQRRIVPEADRAASPAGRLG